MKKADLARTLAAWLHRDQMYNDTTPYFEHLRAVAGRVENAGGDEDLICAAWLHDSLEDTDCFPSTLRNLFGDVVLADVTALTRDKDGTTYADYIEQVAKSERAARIKLEDLRENIQACLALPDDHPKKSLLDRYVKALHQLQWGDA